MRQTLIVVGAMLFLSVSASAQGPVGAGADSHPRTRSGPHPRTAYELTNWQVSLSYQFNRVNLTGSPFDTNGLNASFVRYFGRWIGAEAQVGLGFGNTGATTAPSNLTAKSVFVGGGPRLALRGHGPIEPWVHGIVGMEHFRFSQTSGVLGNNTALAAVGGGGIDFRFSQRASLRVEGDWLGSRFFSVNQRSFQVVSGLVFNF